MAAKKRRLYEVNAHVPQENGAIEDRRFLVEAPGPKEAWKHVADKFVNSEVTLADGVRAAELVTAGTVVEKAAE